MINDIDRINIVVNGQTYGGGGGGTISHNGSSNTIAGNATVNLNSVASVSSSRLKTTTSSTNPTSGADANKPAVSKSANRSTDMNREWDQVSRNLIFLVESKLIKDFFKFNWL